MSSRPISFLTAIVVILSGAAVGWWLGVRASADRQPADLGRLELPVFGSETVDGPDKRPGDVTLLDFWASWCGPCKAQARVLAPLHEEFGDRVRFFAVNVGESPQQVADFVAEDPFPYPVLLDELGDHSASAGIFGLPTLVVLGTEGQVVLRSEGITGRSVLIEALQAALGPSDDAPAAGG